jgi:hypothetical protein
LAAPGEGVVVAPPGGFARALAMTLADAGRRAAMAVAGRRAVLERHAPRPAARARVAALAWTQHSSTSAVPTARRKAEGSGVRAAGPA